VQANFEYIILKIYKMVIMKNNFEKDSNEQENPLRELALGAIPIYGTYLDY
jgi:hypothetical protein